MASLQGLICSSVQSDLRIVIIGNAGDEKNKVVKSVLNCENLTGEKVGLCTLHQCEQAGRRISVVEAPGWERTSQQTAENMKEEVDRSVSLCPPGPHVFLLVIPVKISEEPSISEITAAQMHMELLSERVWKHTILLFACDEGVRDFNIQSCFQKAKKILDKCEGKAYVLESRSKISELFTKIEDLVEENCGDVFKLQAYYELFQWKTESLWRRRGSLQKNPPNMTKDTFYFVALLLILITCMTMMSFSGVPGTELGLHDDLSLAVVLGVCAALIVMSLVVFLFVFLKFNRIEKKLHTT